MAFQEAFSDILIELILEANSFEDFRTAVEKFFGDTNLGYEPEWREAITSVQRGEVTLEGIPVVPANSPRAVVVSVKQVEQVTPQDNSANVQYLLAA